MEKEFANDPMVQKSARSAQNYLHRPTAYCSSERWRSPRSVFEDVRAAGLEPALQPARAARLEKEEKAADHPEAIEEASDEVLPPLPVTLSCNVFEHEWYKMV